MAAVLRNYNYNAYTVLQTYSIENWDYFFMVLIRTLKFSQKWTSSSSLFHLLCQLRVFL